jgi:hypothetical protein
LASSLPSGSPERKAILSGLSQISAQASVKTSAKKGDVVFISHAISDLFGEKTVPRGSYSVQRTDKGEVVLRPYPLRPGEGYVVDAQVLAEAIA